MEPYRQLFIDAPLSSLTPDVPEAPLEPAPARPVRPLPGRLPDRLLPILKELWRIEDARYLSPFIVCDIVRDEDDPLVEYAVMILDG